MMADLYIPPKPAIIRAAELPRSPAEARGIALREAFGPAPVLMMAAIFGGKTIKIAKTYALNSNNDGNGTVSIRTAVQNLAAGGTKIRIRFVASTAQPITVANASVGHRSGSTINTVAAPVELLFGGGSGFALSAGQNIMSDWLNFPTTAGDNLLVIFDCVTNGNFREIDSGGDGFYFRVSFASYNAQAPSGFTTVGDRTECVDLVEVR